MNWISNYVRPKIRSLLPSSKHQIPENAWVRCPESGQMVHHKDLEANQFVFPGSNYHVRMSAQQRFQNFFDGGEYMKAPSPRMQATGRSGLASCIPTAAGRPKPRPPPAVRW